MQETPTGYDHLVYGTDVTWAGGGHIRVDLKNRTVDLDATVLDADGSSTTAEYCGVERVYPLPEGTSVDILARDLADGGALSVLLQRVLDGGETYCGSGNDLRGSLDDDAHEAEEAMATLLESYKHGSGYSVWEACVWLAPLGHRGTLEEAGLMAQSSDDEVESAAKRMVARALDDRVVVWRGDMERHLKDVRNRVREQQAEDEEADA